MRNTRRILTMLLVGALALAGTAAAAPGNDPCPECDADGEPNPQNSYHSVDLGVVDEDDAEALVDTDASYSDTEETGFFAWLQLCFSAFIAKVETLTGVDADVDANAEAYVEEDGADVDATLHTPVADVDFDESPVGDLDGQTWEAMQEVPDLPQDRPHLDDVVPHVPNSDTDVCFHTDAMDLLPCE